MKGNFLSVGKFKAGFCIFVKIPNNFEGGIITTSAKSRATLIKMYWNKSRFWPLMRGDPDWRMWNAVANWISAHVFMRVERPGVLIGAGGRWQFDWPRVCVLTRTDMNGAETAGTRVNYGNSYITYREH